MAVMKIRCKSSRVDMAVLVIKNGIEIRRGPTVGSKMNRKCTIASLGAGVSPQVLNAGRLRTVQQVTISVLDSLILIFGRLVTFFSIFSSI